MFDLVDGKWSNWSEYGSCSKTCGGGMKVRSRTCTNPAPSNNGTECVGEPEEEKECNSHPCPGWCNLNIGLILILRSLTFPKARKMFLCPRVKYEDVNHGRFIQMFTTNIYYNAVIE